MAVTESKSSGRYLDKKIESTIIKLLNEMTVLVDNDSNEDVTLAEMMDRVYRRVLTNEVNISKTNETVQKIVDSGGTTVPSKDSNVQFFVSLTKFPSAKEAKSDVLYVDRSTGMIYLFNIDTDSYEAVVSSTEDLAVTLESVQKVVHVINGGDSQTVI